MCHQHFSTEEPHMETVWKTDGIRVGNMWDLCRKHVGLL